MTRHPKALMMTKIHIFKALVIKTLQIKAPKEIKEINCTREAAEREFRSRMVTKVGKLTNIPDMKSDRKRITGEMTIQIMMMTRTIMIKDIIRRIIEAKFAKIIINEMAAIVVGIQLKKPKRNRNRGNSNRKRLLITINRMIHRI